MFVDLAPNVDEMARRMTREARREAKPGNGPRAKGTTSPSPFSSSRVGSEHLIGELGRTNQTKSKVVPPDEAVNGPDDSEVAFFSVCDPARPQTCLYLSLKSLAWSYKLVCSRLWDGMGLGLCEARAVPAGGCGTRRIESRSGKRKIVFEKIVVLGRDRELRSGTEIPL